ncbi:hypothetical protein H0H81_002777 [Sphagnurus paluster]|uniref:Uncharacterized protein n=1 Tax=Sphagnurus paluster TaxID=117069 RepID=A0A9P7FSQ3_9AGAR|nr:hypothetical protein H0H81_002777 [Sphagnurus paluster]
MFKALAPKLVYLEIAGDLIELKILAVTKWPRLRSLRLVDHVPHGDIIPLPEVVFNMPLLSTLAYEFNIGCDHRTPSVFYREIDQTPSAMRLCDILPELKRLSVSSIWYGARLEAQLPRSLEAVCVGAPCARLSFPHGRTAWRYHYTALSEPDALCWIEAAAKLPYLTELALHLVEAPSPDMLAAIARACPSLRTLELEQVRYDYNLHTSPYPIESFARPLMTLSHLRVLRITLELGSHNRPSFHNVKQEFISGIDERIQEAAQLLAERISAWNV